MPETQAFREAQITFTDVHVEKQVPQRAPYAFVPTGDRVLTAPVAPRHDRPLPDAVSGRLKIRVTAETPILVGGGRIGVGADGGQNDLNNEPCRAPDNRWMIPGTSLRGMVRTVLESAAFARMSFVDDCAAASRDFEDPTWKAAISAHGEFPRNGGWLFITREGWRLVPAETTERVDFNEVLGWVGTNEAAWHAENMHARLDRLETNTKLGIVDATTLGRTGRARLVVGGPTADTDRTGDTRKQHEHLFFWPGNPTGITISPRTGELFVASLDMDANTHTGDPQANYSALTANGRATGFAENWQFWCRNGRQNIPAFDVQENDPDSWALPVFWRNRGAGDNGAAQDAPRPDTILSLTAFLRVPYKNGLDEIIKKAPKPDPAHMQDYDLVQALLGWAAPEVDPDKPIADRTPEERALRSRVRFGFLLSENTATDTTLISRTWAATRPYASFWPYYLCPKTDTATHPVDFDNGDAIVAGRKRYPARNGAAETLPHVVIDQQNFEESSRQAADRNSNLNFLPAGTAFEGEIRLHNVTPVELGALLWALTFGQIGADGHSTDAGYRHMLGRARTWGYGQLKLELVPEDTDIRSVIAQSNADLAAAITAFKDWVCTGLDADDFEGIETIRRLLNTAHAATGAALADRLCFPAVNGDASAEDSIVKGYSEIRKAAQKLGRANQNAPREAGRANFVGLPPYPRVDPP